MYSSKLSISKRFSMSVTWNILYILPCSVNLKVHNIVQEQGRVNLPGTFELSAFVHDIWHLYIHLAFYLLIGLNILSSLLLLLLLLLLLS